VNAIWRALGGVDAPGKRAIPAGEFFHPLTLLALALLVLNDRVLKGSAPGVLTGKLSDVAGLASFPLVLTAAVDTLLWLVRAPVDFTLRRWKLAAAIAVTGAGFAVVKIWPPAARALEDALAGVFGHARIVQDPTDLLTLPALALAWWIGAQELRRVPLGRVEHTTRRARKGLDTTHDLDDTAFPDLAPLLAAGAPEAAERLRQARGM
jgi:hypothetical protein